MAYGRRQDSGYPPRAVDAGAAASLIIRSTIRNGTTVAVDALAALRVGGVSRLFAVRLSSGQVRPQGDLRQRDHVIGIAIPLDKQ